MADSTARDEECGWPKETKHAYHLKVKACRHWECAEALKIALDKATALTNLKPRDDLHTHPQCGLNAAGTLENIASFGLDQLVLTDHANGPSAQYVNCKVEKRLPAASIAYL